MKQFALLTIIAMLVSMSFAQRKEKSDSKTFTKKFQLNSCSFMTTGRNLYFILEPGYQLILEGFDGKDSSRLVITVLHETKIIGNVKTRIVEEKESVNDKIIEISRNYYAFCKETSTVYYFGEDVDMYKNGQIVSHVGSWLAEGKNKAGVAMPGLILLGARYYQEIAPGVAMDRAEIVSSTETKSTYAGVFNSCLKTEETTELNLKEKEYKLYAPGIGLINDGDVWIVKYGFVR